MGKAPCCEKAGLKKGAWSPEEDEILVQYIQKHGHGCWRTLPKNAGLQRCGKSCRLRWTNYLRPDIKRGPFSPEDEATIIQLHNLLGNKWAAIAAKLPGRTDNEIKNYWNTRLRKRLLSACQKLQIHQPSSSSESPNIKCDSSSTCHMIQWESSRVEAEARQSMDALLINPSSAVKFEHDYYLRLWNSEVGDSFRKIEVKNGAACQSPIPQTASPVAVESNSVDKIIKAKPMKTSTSSGSGCEEEDSLKPKAEPVTSSDSIGISNEFADSSDTALTLLLDHPGGDDMEFIQSETQTFPDFVDLRCD